MHLNLEKLNYCEALKFKRLQFLFKIVPNSKSSNLNFENHKLERFKNRIFPVHMIQFIVLKVISKI